MSREERVEVGVNLLFNKAERGSYVFIEFAGAVFVQIGIIQRKRNVLATGTHLEMRWEFASGEPAVVKEYAERQFLDLLRSLELSRNEDVSKISLAKTKGRMSEQVCFIDPSFYEQILGGCTTDAVLDGEGAAASVVVGDQQRKPQQQQQHRRRREEVEAAAAAAIAAAQERRQLEEEEARVQRKAHEATVRQQAIAEVMEREHERHIQQQQRLSERQQQAMMLASRRQRVIAGTIQSFNDAATDIANNNLSHLDQVSSSPSMPFLQALLVPSSQRAAEVPPQDKEKRREELMAAASAYANQQQQQQQKQQVRLDTQSSKLLINPFRSHHGRYVQLTAIGRGTFGTVFAALDLMTNEAVALKFINNPERRDLGGINATLFREAIMARVVASPLLTPVRDVMLLGDGRCCIAMPLNPYDVRDLVNKRFFVSSDSGSNSAGPLLQGHHHHQRPAVREPNINLIRSVFGQLLEALDDMHRVCGAEHRDVKLSNVMLNKEGVVQLGDFGWARMPPVVAPSCVYGGSGSSSSSNEKSAGNFEPDIIKPPESYTEEQLMQMTLDEIEAMEKQRLLWEMQERRKRQRYHLHYPDGTERPERVHTGPAAGMNYRPLPQLLDPTFEYSGQKLDIYGAGCVLWELLTGTVLFAGDSDAEVAHTILQVMGAPEPAVWSKWKREGIRLGLISQTASFQRQPVRLKAHLRKHGVNDDDKTMGLARLMEDMLHFDEAKRPTAAQILNDHESYPLFGSSRDSSADNGGGTPPYERALDWLKLGGTGRRKPQHMTDLQNALPRGWCFEFESRRRQQERRAQMMVEQQQRRKEQQEMKSAHQQQ